MHEAPERQHLRHRQGHQFLQDITCLSSPTRLPGRDALGRAQEEVLKWIRNYGDMDVYITESDRIDDQSLENDELRKY